MIDIKDIYLNTPMKRYEFMRLKITDILEEIIKEYRLDDKVTADGYIYMEIQKGMYSLPQAGIIAQELLKNRLAKHGYTHKAKSFQDSGSMPQNQYASLSWPTTSQSNTQWNWMQNI